LVSLASAASVPVSISADEPEQEVSLRYKYLPGELLKYRTRITWQFDAGETHNRTSFEAHEMLLGLGSDEGAESLSRARSGGSSAP